MYYDLKGFGECIRDIRKSKSMTQKDIVMKTLINQETIRRVENGLVLPKQETLDLLSMALNIDVAKIFLYYRCPKDYMIKRLKRQVEISLEYKAYNIIQENINSLRKILERTTEDFTKNEIYQFIFMIEGIILSNNGNYEQAIEKYISALCYGRECFKIKQYKNYYYNELEIRVLMKLALTRSKQGYSEEAQEILVFCISFYERNRHFEDDYLILKLYRNVAYT